MGRHFPHWHAEYRWMPRQDFANIANAPVVEVFAAGINAVVHHFPIGFVKLGDDFQPITLVGP
tara:strand:- start:233 stop:421 length:189 start_codon:yes stop_codon:yes gene_type:complete